MGHWGRFSAARKAPETDPADLPIQKSGQCARCERWTMMPGGVLPPGWSEIDCQAVCPDCTPRVLADAEREVNGAMRAANESPPPPARRRTSIGPTGVRYMGCRIGHEIVHQMANLEIKAGASAPPGRDEAISFLLDANALDQLIIELSDIRRKLARGKRRG